MNLSPGIEITLDNMPDNGVLLVITDAGTKQRELAESIQRKASLSLFHFLASLSLSRKAFQKNIKIFIGFVPRCEARVVCRRSMPSYNLVSEGRVFNLTDFNSDQFFKAVVSEVRKVS